MSAYRKAMTDVELSGGMATGIVMHPIQYEGIELAFAVWTITSSTRRSMVACGASPPP